MFLQEKIATLQRKSPQERMRAAVYITVGVGIVVVLVWLVILLPIQLYFVTTGDEEISAEQRTFTQFQQEAPQLNDLFAPNPTQAPTPTPVTLDATVSALPTQVVPGTVEPPPPAFPPSVAPTP